MILDKENMFSYQQAVTALTSGTNIIDLGYGDAGPSERLSLFVSASAPITGGTLIIGLSTADEVDGAGMLVEPVEIAYYSPSEAQLEAGGKLVAARLPHGCKRYVTLSYETAGTLTGGTITAGLVLDAQADMPHPVTAG
jgi:hypothetical protein